MLVLASNGSHKASHVDGTCRTFHVVSDLCQTDTGIRKEVLKTIRSPGWGYLACVLMEIETSHLSTVVEFVA